MLSGKELKGLDFENLDGLLKSRISLLNCSLDYDFKLNDYVFYLINEDVEFELGHSDNVCFVVKDKVNLKVNNCSKKKGKFLFILFDSLNAFFGFSGEYDAKVVHLSDSEFNVLADSKSVKLSLKIFSDSNVESKANLAFISRDSVCVNASINAKKKSKSSFNLMSVNLDKFSASAVAKADSDDSDVSVDLRCLHLGKSVELIPVLKVNNNDVKASHSALSFGFDEGALFYFMSKGLSRKDAELLFAKETLGKYLKGKFFDEFIEKVSL